jgi:choline trimethylamine-lyase
VCSQVPGGPARTFHEAIQSLWFVQIGLLMEGFGYSYMPGELDQYLWPYYKKDVESGTLTPSHAKDLLKFLFVKMNSFAHLLSNSHSKYFLGFPMCQIITVGGTTAEGEDATNALSYMLLEADAEVGLTQPETVVKVHPKMPEDFLIAACHVAKQCVGKLKFIGDEVAVRKLVNCGYPEADARRYVLIGCHEPFVQGISHFWPGGHVSLAKCLEFALNDGKDRLTGRQVGLRTGDPRNFSSVKEIVDALFVHVRYFFRHLLDADEVMFRAVAEHWPTPFQSSLIRGCISKGLDCFAKGADYNFSWFSTGGMANVGDALAAIQKVVFEERKISMAQLIDALDSNFAHAPDVLELLKSAPKYGNDDDYVDLLVKDLAARWCEEVQPHAVWDDIIAQAAVAIITGNIPYGATIGATPDGRLAGEPLGEGGISPVQGRNTSGATATIKSVAKIDHASMKSGSVFNMRFDPAVLKNEESIKRFAALIQTYCLLGGFHVQFNIVDSQTLREAQIHPEDYRDLLVRVATYTSYFTELGRELQDNIIERVECGDV